MAQDIGVNRFTIKSLFESCVNEGDFLIPEYQRPYTWDIDKIDALFEDIRDFMLENKDSTSPNYYFLGSIITFKKENFQEIIDGQQRVTSLLLLLRAIYTRIAGAPIHIEAGDSLLHDIEPLIWNNIGDIVNKKYGKNSPHVKSEVLLDEDSKVMCDILRTGTADPKVKDHYSKNYLRFQERIAKDLQADALLYFSRFLLERVIVMNILADNEDTALTIFSTLNDRGEPLTDADIFKVQIYKNLSGENKKSFVENWKVLDSEAKRVNESIQHLFYYYMMLCRAKSGDVNTSTPKLRTYFLKQNVSFLKDEKILKKLERILVLWKVIYGVEVEEAWAKNRQICNILDCLLEYPNEYWKYPVIVFYFFHFEEENFEECFLKFLRKLLVKLLVNYLVSPNVTTIKSDVMNLNKASVTSIHPEFRFNKIKNIKDIKNYVCKPGKMVRMLLKVLAYEEQKEKLVNFEIEHIFPKKWNKNFFPNFASSYVDDMIEHLGNKIPLEKKLNIVASNNFYSKKVEVYSKSKIKLVNEFAEFDTWNLPDDILKRDGCLTKQIIELLSRWDSEY